MHLMRGVNEHFFQGICALHTFQRYVRPSNACANGIIISRKRIEMARSRLLYRLRRSRGKMYCMLHHKMILKVHFRPLRHSMALTKIGNCVGPGLLWTVYLLSILFASLLPHPSWLARYQVTELAATEKVVEVQTLEKLNVEISTLVRMTQQHHHDHLYQRGEEK